MTAVSICRFVHVESDKVKSRLNTEVKGLSTDVEALNKKLHYLDTTLQKSQEHINAILKRAS